MNYYNEIKNNLNIMKERLEEWDNFIILLQIYKNMYIIEDMIRWMK